MPRTKKPASVTKSAHVALEPFAQQLLARVSDLSEVFDMLHDQNIQDAFVAAVEEEAAEWPCTAEEDRQYFRDFAAAQVGYRFGLMVAGRRMAGGVR